MLKNNRALLNTFAPEKPPFYLLLIGLIGLGVGLTTSFTVLVGASAFLVGAFMSPSMPIWAKPNSPLETISSETGDTVGKEFGWVFLSIPVVVALLTIITLVAFVLGDIPQQ